MASFAQATCDVCGLSFPYDQDRTPVPPSICQPHPLLRLIRKCRDRAFVRCDAHPARGGPHLSRGLYVGPYFDHPADLVSCTHRYKSGNVCGNVFMVLRRKEG